MRDVSLGKVGNAQVGVGTRGGKGICGMVERSLTHSYASLPLPLHHIHPARYRIDRTLEAQVCSSLPNGIGLGGSGQGLVKVPEKTDTPPQQPMRQAEEMALCRGLEKIYRLLPVCYDLGELICQAAFGCQNIVCLSHGDRILTLVRCHERLLRILYGVLVLPHIEICQTETDRVLTEEHWLLKVIKKRLAG